MKAPALLLTLLLCASSPILRAETDDLAETFREALFEEEASRDFEKAIAAYEQVVEGYATQRKMAASALFRLAECHRKLDHKEEAAKYYRQLLADFPAEETLAKLARENLVAMGEQAPDDGAATAMNDPGISAEEQEQIDEARRLLENSPDLLRGTLLHIAAEESYLKLAGFLLDNGIDVNSRDGVKGDGETPLHHAAREGHLAMVDLLLTRGAEVNLGTREGLTALHLAVLHNNLSVVRALLKAGAAQSGKSPFLLGTNPTRSWNDPFAYQPTIDPSPRPAATPFPGQATPLHLACINFHFEVAEALIKAGADVNATGDTGITPLDSVLRDPSGEKFVRLLLESGADVKASNAKGTSILMIALYHDQPVEMVKRLLAAGADPNHRDAEGTTALHLALAANKPELAALLVESGADPLIADEAGKTPVDLALQTGSLDTLNLIKERGVDLKIAVTGDLGAALLAACSRGHVALVEWLLEAGANPNAMDGYYSCLYYAVASGDTALLRLLLEAEAKPDAPGSHPPLFAALQPFQERNPVNPRGTNVVRPVAVNLEMLQALLDAGADPNVRGSTGGTVLHLLLDTQQSVRREPEIVSLLLDHGADPRLTDNQGRRPVDVLDSSAAKPAGFAPLWEATYYDAPTRAEGIWASIPSQRFEKVFSATRGGTSTLRLSDFILGALNIPGVLPAAEPWTFRILRYDSGETETIDLAAWADGKIEDPVLAWGDIVEMAHGQAAPLAWERIDPEAGERTRILVERLRKKITLQMHGKTLDYTCVPKLPLLSSPFLEPTRHEIAATTAEELVSGLRDFDPTISARFRIENAEAGSSVTLDLSEESRDTPLLSGDTVILDAPGFADPQLAHATAAAISISREDDGFLAVIRPDTFPVSLPDMLAEAFRLHALSHPDLERMVVIRPISPFDNPEAAAGDGEPKAATRIEMPLTRLRAALADETSPDSLPGLLLQPGDRIEIPALESAEGDWTGLSEDIAAFLQEQTKANVTLSVLGQADRKVLLAPTFQAYDSRFGLASLNGVISPLGAAVDADTRWLASALSFLGYTSNKYELGKIEVSSQVTDTGVDAEGRGVSATRSGSSRYFDLNASPPPVWLRSGDKIGFRAKDESATRRRVILPPSGNP